MTKEEFLKLDYGNIVVCKRFPGEVYQIDDTDVFGVGNRDPIFRVFGAKDRTNNKDIRIDMQNYDAWDVLPWQCRYYIWKKRGHNESPKYSMMHYFL